MWNVRLDNLFIHSASTEDLVARGFLSGFPRKKKEDEQKKLISKKTEFNEDLTKSYIHIDEIHDIHNIHIF